MFRLFKKLRLKLRNEGFKKTFRKVCEILIFKFINIILKPLHENINKDESVKLYNEFTELVNQIPLPKILEIGSRDFRGMNRRPHFTNPGEYIGFDYYSGNNVDVVGDSHHLSNYFPSKYFDAVFSISVFEHIGMPWKVILEINKIMKIGGVLCIGTHANFPPHELPADYWRFLTGSFQYLLNQYTGFEIIKCIEGIPARMISMSTHKPHHGISSVNVNTWTSVLAKKTGDFNPNLLNWQVNPLEVTKDKYPTDSRT